MRQLSRRLRPPERTIQVGLVVVTLLLLLCVALRPSALGVNDGFSYFGYQKSTVVPYAAGLILYAYYLWKTAGWLDGRVHVLLVFGFRAMAVCLIGLVITPADLVDSIHMVFGAVLFALQLLVSIWIAGWLARSTVHVTLTVIEFAGGLMAFYYLPGAHGLLLQAQAIFQLAFGLLLASYCERFARTPDAQP